MHLLAKVAVVALLCCISLVAGTSTEETENKNSVCVGKIGEMYCRSWDEFVKVLRRLLEDCKSTPLSEDFLSNMQACLKNKTVASLDRMLKSDVIPLVGGFELVRYTSLFPTNRSVSDGRRFFDEEEKWKWQVLDRMYELFKSHVIRLRMDVVEGRGRHHMRHLFPLMMFAFMKLLVVLVPLGFQFMAVISGKALLLSKMALMLASAQAMKKVTSAWFDVYHTPYYHVHRSYEGDDHHHHHHVPHHHQHHFQDWHAAPSAHSPQFDTQVQYVLPAASDHHQSLQFGPVPSVYDLPVADQRMDNNKQFSSNGWQ
ncbi:hypothetical protein C0J52_13539 [Blattella germanica]|nr:hypothetical protein C0J52_13539 [Blattella germanica]